MIGGVRTRLYNQKSNSRKLLFPEENQSLHTCTKVHRKSIGSLLERTILFEYKGVQYTRLILVPVYNGIVYSENGTVTSTR